MKSWLVGPFALLLAACSHPRPVGSAPGAPSDGTRVLLDSAAADFRAHGPAATLRFRAVHAGRLTGADGAVRDILCGQFQPAQGGATAGWAQFATIRTSGYEQWLGAQAEAYCERSALEAADLSADLQSRYASPR